MMLSISSLIFAATVGMTATAAEVLVHKEVTIKITDVYVPDGLNSQMEAFVVVSGIFPNLCYKWARAEIMQETPRMHEIRAIAIVLPGECPMMIRRFQNQVNLGRLPTGEHTLRFVNGDGTYFEKSIAIE